MLKYAGSYNMHAKMFTVPLVPFTEYLFVLVKEKRNSAATVAVYRRASTET